MHIAGFNPNSFVDYPDNIAAVVFISGCNLDCWYCHNKWILKSKDNYSEEAVFERIRKNKDFLDAVVISGGEPTLANTDELIAFIKKIKELGLKVKLDTNGTNYEVLLKLLPLLDYVAMDIKAPLDKYGEISPINPIQINNIQQSIGLLINNIECEFRTTFVSTLSIEDIFCIAETIKGCKNYYIQQYVPIEEYKEIKAHPPEYLRNVCKALNEKGYPCELRGI
ncbi:MAG: anaerobic ribonucleoside-triphosphate reductase activating protein [Clostridia bacterium]|nr:anaerobic ribonucleoside-triphosphate reductase activating protein [Clostridia bacterium]